MKKYLNGSIFYLNDIDERAQRVSTLRWYLKKSGIVFDKTLFGIYEMDLAPAGKVASEFHAGIREENIR